MLQGTWLSRWQTGKYHTPFVHKNDNGVREYIFDNNNNNNNNNTWNFQKFLMTQNLAVHIVKNNDDEDCAYTSEDDDDDDEQQQ